MYIRKTVKKIKDKDGKEKEYENYLLVESVMTPKGPRQKIICSLGNLKPAPVEKWHELSQKVENAISGQITIKECAEADKEIEDKTEEIVNKVEKSKEIAGKRKQEDKKKSEEVIEVVADKVEVEECREGGPEHVGLEYWKRLELDKILKEVGLSEKSCELTKIMTMNRFISPMSEHAMVEWIKTSGLGDLSGKNYNDISNDSLYRNMDKLYKKREEIEKRLGEQERSLFNLDMTIYLYDLTSVYFEGNCLRNPQAKRGYSKDGRPDCNQLVVGIVFNRDGFPLAHEIFDGNTTDKSTVKEMLDLLEKRCGKVSGNTVVIDRGMSTDENMKEIIGRGYHYVVASRQSERQELLDKYEEEEGWNEVIREVSPTNPYQKKSVVKVKEEKEMVYKVTEETKERIREEIDIKKLDSLLEKECSRIELIENLKKKKFGEKEIERIISECKGREEVKILCISEGREEKDRAIRESQEKKFLSDLKKMQKRILKGDLKEEDKVNQAIGRLKERYPRVGRYYEITYNREFEINEEIIEKLKCEIASDKLTSIEALSGNKFSAEVLNFKLKELHFTKEERKVVSKHSERRILAGEELEEKKKKAEKLDGAYLLKTDRLELDKEEIWNIYSLLTRAEAAFRAMKSPLAERPIFHHLEHRAQTHIFLCILAYHLLVAVETTLKNNGVHTSWTTVREALKTHQICTVVLPTPGKSVMKIRKGSTPEPHHKEIYDKLGITSTLMKPIKTWHYKQTQKNSDGTFT